METDETKNPVLDEEETTDEELQFEDEIESEHAVTDVEESTEEAESELTVEQELAKAKAEAAKWRRIAQKAQAKPKTVETKTVQTEAKPTDTVDVDERILKANGMEDELLKELKAISAARGVSLIDAQNDYLFIAAKEKFEKEKASRKASLSSSRGSGQPKPKLDFNTPGLSREEHMRLVKEGR